MLNGFGTVVNSLKMRAKPYLPQICGTIKWRLNNKNAKIRQQAADLIARIAMVMKVRQLLPPALLCGCAETVDLYVHLSSGEWVGWRCVCICFGGNKANKTCGRGLGQTRICRQTRTCHHTRCSKRDRE